jgi:hypothetical protein
MPRKYIYIAAAVGLAGIILAWLYFESIRPLPGQKQADLGRGHVPVGTQVDYKTNPPTSGPHYEQWTKAGVYDQPLDDRNLVHSLEHGYIVMSYRCNQALSQGESTPSAEASPSGQIDSPEDCNTRKANLEKVYNEKGTKKIIVVERQMMESDYALAAWNYLDSFNDFDKNRVVRFIDAHRDNGPERTME